MHPTLVDWPYIGITAVLLALSGSVACSHPPVEQSQPARAPATQAFSSYDQIIQSPTTNLSVSANEKFDIPVRIENPGTDTWASTGSTPVNVSYKWFLDGKMLAIEGERTVLPKPLGPKMSAELPVHVVAPSQPGKYELRVTLVQEGITWFMTKGTGYLALPVSIR